MSDLVIQTDEMIRFHRLLPEGCTVLVATSGGLDSMVLLHVLHQLSSSNRWIIAAAHFNHNLRGDASDKDESLVRRQSEKLKIPLYRSDGDVRGYARRKGLSLEMAARELRHAFLAQTALEHEITTVATAHHADDQAELFVLRLLRGAGAGLAGMKQRNPSPADAGVQLVRPFLNRTKAELRDYATRERIQFSEDATNRTNAIPRNRIRNQVLPILCKNQPGFIANALRTMEIVGGESEFSRLTASRWLARRKRSGFDVLHPAVQRHVIQLQLIKIAIRPTFDLVESLRVTAGRVVTAAPGCQVHRDERGGVHVQPGWADKFNEVQRAVSIKAEKGRVEFDGVTLQWCVCRHAARGSRRPGVNHVEEWFDADRVGETVILRHWQSGDRFQPIGMSRTVKLQDFLTNQKVPRNARRRLVIATTSEGEVFWVEGARIGERFKLGGGTARRLGWRWSRQGSRY